MKSVTMFIIGMIAGMCFMYWGYQHQEPSKFFIENWWAPQHSSPDVAIYHYQVT